MSLLYARTIFRDALIGKPELSKLPPEEFVRIIDNSMTVSVGEKGNLPIHATYRKSNIKGVYYLLLCDICGTGCRKIYARDVYYNTEVKLKLLCGKCAHISYKKKTKTEKLALKMLINPDFIDRYDFRNLTTSNAIAILEAEFLRERIEDQSQILLNKATSKKYPEIVE